MPQLLQKRARTGCTRRTGPGAAWCSGPPRRSPGSQTMPWLRTWSSPASTMAADQDRDADRRGGRADRRVDRRRRRNGSTAVEFSGQSTKSGAVAPTRGHVGGEVHRSACDVVLGSPAGGRRGCRSPAAGHVALDHRHGRRPSRSSSRYDARRGRTMAAHTPTSDADGDQPGAAVPARATAQASRNPTQREQEGLSPLIPTYGSAVRPPGCRRRRRRAVPTASR